MDHHDHMNHGDMNHGDMAQPQCSMNMLFTWSTENLCIVFRSWRVTNTFSLIISLLLIVLLCAGYEAVRELSRRYEAQCASRFNSVLITSDDLPIIKIVNETSSLLALGRKRPEDVTTAERTSEILKSALYGVQVFYSFFIMLLFMTYNGWVMGAVAVGAMLGHLLFGVHTSVAKSVACH